jgi:signal transduction histidine kinase
LDVTSIDAGRLAVCPIVADAAVALREAAETWIPIALARSIKLRVINLGHLEARFDPDRVLQIIGNLIANAVKFSHTGGTVSIGVERLESEARFWVQDHGPGIPENMLELIFERFWQRRTCDRQGLGLGLYISRCLVAAHSGRIWAESKRGAGTTVLFTVPTT